MPARPRLNLFSPLPPQQSDIANHSLMVAGALSELADVTLWTQQDETPVLQTQGGRRLDLPVVHFDPARVDWTLLNQADAQIYNVGNNTLFHRGILHVAREAPGLMVLHDTRLQHFFADDATREPDDRQRYLARLRRSHGLAAVADAERWLAGEETLETLVERYPMTTSAVELALAVIVHNREERRRLAGEAHAPVFYLPLVYEAAPPIASTAAGDTLRLVAFGYFGPNRRLPQLLDILANLPDQDVELDIFGIPEDTAAIDAQVAALGLGSRVRRHGFVPNQLLRDALARADLAVNLRYPSMGEASGSQLRIWEASLPSLVTRTGWYATLPADAVFFVDPQHEAEDVRRHLQALRDDPERFRQAGRRGRAILEADHTPEGYARGLLEIAMQTPAFHAKRAALELSRRSARAMLGLAGVEGVALCAAEAAAAAAALAGEAITR